MRRLSSADWLPIVLILSFDACRCIFRSPLSLSLFSVVCRRQSFSISVFVVRLSLSLSVFFLSRSSWGDTVRLRNVKIQELCRSSVSLSFVPFCSIWLSVCRLPVSFCVLCPLSFLVSVLCPLALFVSVLCSLSFCLCLLSSVSSGLCPLSLLCLSFVFPLSLLVSVLCMPSVSSCFCPLSILCLFFSSVLYLSSASFFLLSFICPLSLLVSVLYLSSVSFCLCPLSVLCLFLSLSFVCPLSLLVSVLYLSSISFSLCPLSVLCLFLSLSFVCPLSLFVSVLCPVRFSVSRLFGVCPLICCLSVDLTASRSAFVVRPSFSPGQSFSLHSVQQRSVDQTRAVSALTAGQRAMKSVWVDYGINVGGTGEGPD